MYCNAEGILESSYKNDIFLYNTEGLFTLRCESVCNDTDTLPPRKVTFYTCNWELGLAALFTRGYETLEQG